MSDQADRLRQLVRDTVKQHPALAPGVPLVVLSGGKRGVGVSTVATELVHELAALGKRSVLVDANALQPNLATQLGIDVHTGLADVLNGSRSAIEVLKPMGDRMQLLPGQWGAESPPELGRAAIRRLVDELRSLHAQADVVVLDAGSGMCPWVQQLWKSAQQILLVTTDESAAVMDSYATVKLSPWGDVDGKLRLVVNQCDDQATAKEVGTRFEATCRRFLGIRVEEASRVATQPDIITSVTHRNTENDQREFRQSMRLLAADVTSNSLAFASKTSQGSADQHSVGELRLPATSLEKSLQKTQ